MHAESPPPVPVRGSIPWQVLTLSLLLTCLATYYLLFTEEHREQLRFQGQVERAQRLIEDRMETYLALLRATTGLFAVQEPVHAEAFRTFVSKLELRKRYPGLQGIGFSRRGAPAEAEALVAAMRQQGISDFRIWPDSPRPEVHTILFLEPLDRRNRAALGYDMFTDPGRRAAMERARDTGAPALTGKVILVQEIEAKKQPGFLLYLPVYRRGLPLDTVEDRRFALLGFVYSPFRAADFLQEVLGPERVPGIAVEVHSGREPLPGNLLYRSARPSHPRFFQASTFEIGGSPWTLAVSSLPSFEASSGRRQAWVVLLAGLLTSAILFVLSRSQVQARMEAEQAAADLRRSEEALRESGERYRQLVELSPEAIFIQREGRFAFVNSALVRLLGVASPDEIQGQPVLDFIHPGSRERAAQRGSLSVPHLLRPSPVPEKDASPSIGPGILVEERWISRGGRTLEVEAAASTFLDQGTPVTQVLLRDITGRKSVERRLREVASDNARLYEAERLARAEAETANQAKDRFMASLSHELRTPLTPVLALIALLEKEDHLPPGILERLATIRRNVELEARLIDDLLDLTRITRGKLELKLEVADLREVLRHALDACCPPGAPNRERFEILLPEGEDLRVWADAPRLTQVFWNLMTNALKFSPDGGAIRVRVHRDSAAGEIAAEVSDQGIGIDPERLPHVFDAFEQGQRSITRQYGGLGLGLAITKAILELHGGRIQAESDGPGRGASFSIRLPIGASHLPALEPDRQAAHPATSPEGAEDRPLHILLVEDHPDTADAMESLLSAVGHRVTVANTARDALAAAEANQAGIGSRGGIDLVISDVGLPDISGHELMKELKSRFHLRGIALSGYGMDEDVQRSQAAGFSRHLTKPVNLQALKDTIREVAREQASAGIWHSD